MLKKNKYLKAGSFYLLGNFFNKGLAFLTIPIFTRILSTNDYGIINTYTAWVAVLTMILGMTFHMGIRAAFVDYKEEIDNFISSITFFTIISSFFISLIIIIGIILSPYNVNLALLLMCLIQGFFSAIIQNYSMYLVMNLNYKWNTLLLIMPNLIINVTSILFVIFVFKNNAYLGKIIPSAAFTTFFGIILLILIFKKSIVLINKKYWQYALSVSLPIILHGLALTILSQSDRIMITSLVSASETGVYSLVYNFSMIANVVIISLEGVWVPWFTKRISERRIDLINTRVKTYIAIISVVTVSIILVAPEILKLMAPKDYWHGILLIPPIVLSSFIIFIYTLYVNIEHFHKKTRKIALNTIVAALSNIILNFIFLPRYGMFAAAFTTLISYLISLTLHYKIARNIEKDLFSVRIVLIPIFFLFSTTVIFYIFIDNYVLRWGIWIIFLVFIGLRMRENIIAFLKG